MNELRCWPFCGLYFTANKKVKREYQDLLNKAIWKWGMAPCRCIYIYIFSLILAQHTFQGTRAEIVDSIFTCTHPFACCFPTDFKSHFQVRGNSAHSFFKLTIVVTKPPLRESLLSMRQTHFILIAQWSDKAVTPNWPFFFFFP